MIEDVKEHIAEEIYLIEMNDAPVWGWHQLSDLHPDKVSARAKASRLTASAEAKYLPVIEKLVEALEACESWREGTDNHKRARFLRSEALALASEAIGAAKIKGED